MLLERTASSPIAPNVAGDLPEIGLTLPATPLQHLLLHELGTPLVMTSGNRSGEPIVATDHEALDALGHIADGFLGNNLRSSSHATMTPSCASTPMAKSK